MEACSDAELVKAFQAGDEPAFAELVARHRKQVYRVARGILRNHEAADEAAQEAFVKAWQALPDFRGDASFKTWIYRIAMNVAFDTRDRESSRRRATDESALEAVVVERRAPRPLAVDELVREEERAFVRSAIARLPDRQRLTLTLRVHEGLQYKEIAEVLGCAVGTAKANFHHAVQNLRQELQPGGSGRALRAETGGGRGSSPGDAHDA